MSDRKPAQYDPLGSRGGTRLHPPPHGLLITTNLDNDDALASDALELLRREIRPCPGKRIYSLLYGYQYFTSERFLLKMRYTNNHFLTLVEPFDDRAETIIAYRHTRAIRQQPTVYISSPHGKWLEIVHEDNVSNDLRINAKVRNIPVLRGRTFSDFGLPELRVTARRQWFQTLFLLPVRFLVTGAKRLRGKRARLRRK
ncbi:glycosyltransferase [Alistipes dispar]|uniref:glycosyltransferase n=1 Tax=Alistipes dispar TaxID=2585119 RepID=UPI002589AF45|nr:glycosyltransferase [uncultured Alistipes sp.]